MWQTIHNAPYFRSLELAVLDEDWDACARLPLQTRCRRVERRNNRPFRGCSAYPLAALGRTGWGSLVGFRVHTIAVQIHYAIDLTRYGPMSKPTFRNGHLLLLVVNPFKG